jgi:MFS family permease
MTIVAASISRETLSNTRLSQLPSLATRSKISKAQDNYKWIVAAAATLAMMSGFVAFTTVSVFMLPLMLETGWSKSEISMAYTLMSGGAATGGVVIGRLADHVNTRAICMSGALFLGIAFALLSIQDGLSSFLLLHLAMGAIGCACLYAPVIATTGLWFSQRRGLAIGIVTAGGTVGQGLTPLVLQPLISTIGWQDTYRFLATFFIVAVTPAMCLIVKPPAQSGPSVADKALWPIRSSVSVFWLGGAAFLCCAAMAVPLVHLIPLMIECGRSPIMAGGLFMTIMMAGTAGRISFGLLSDRTGALIAYMLASLMQAATLFWFVIFDSGSLLLLTGAVFGFGYAGVMTALNLSVREAVPWKSAGLSTAVVGMLAWAGMGAGGGLGGYLYDFSGNYQLAFLVATLTGIGNLLSLLALWMHIRRTRMR